MTKEEFESAKRVFNYLVFLGLKPKQLGMTLENIHSYWKSLSTRSFKETLSEWTKTTEKFFQENPEERKIFGKIAKSPFTISSLYNIDRAEGTFKFPK